MIGPRWTRSAIVLAFCSILTPAVLAAESSRPASRRSFDEFWEEYQRSTEEIVGDILSLRPGNPHYSEEVAKTGAQGRVILLVDVSKDGRVTQARVQTSSRSMSLDDAAIRKALTMRYQGRGAPPATASLIVDFTRDHPFSVASKSCSEFNTDVAWFRTAFPGRPETDMRTIELLGGLVRLSANSQDQWRRAPVLEALPFAQCNVVPACASRPHATLNETFYGALNDYIAHPEKRSNLCAFGSPSTIDRKDLPRSLLRLPSDEPVRIRDQEITPDKSDYPGDLVRSGVQGRVLLEASLKKDGKISDIVVTGNESGVDALADAAIEYVRRMPITGAVPPIAADAIVVVTVVFRKDTDESVKDKTCADFAVDFAAFVRVHPDQDLRLMSVVRPALTALQDRAIRENIDYVRQRAASSLDVRKTAERCAQQPQAKFLDMLEQQVRSPEQ